MKGAIAAVVLFALLFALDHFRWEILRLSERSAAHNAVFNLGINPLMMRTIFIICALVVGGVIGNWNRIVHARNKYIPLLLTIPLLVLVFIRILN